MRKFVGFTLQSISLIIFGYAFLNNSLVLIADWLSPILTGKIYSIFALIYLLIGDPIKYPIIFVIWAITSTLTGVLIRKRVGTILTVTTTWLFVISLLGLLSLNIIVQAQNNIIFNENTDPFDIVPPLPEGLTLTSLYETPIFGETLQFISSIIEEGGEDIDPFNILTCYANLFIFSIFSKPLISTIFSLIGVELGKRMEIIVDPALTQKRLIIKNKLVKESQLITLIIILMIGTFTAPINAYSSEEIYTENLVALAEEDGQLFIFGAFAGNKIQGMDENIFNFEGYLGTVLISHKDISDVFYEYIQPPEETDISEILNLLPETVILSVYIDQESEYAESHSDLIAEELSSYYNMDIMELLSFTQKIDEDEFTHTFTVNIYQSSLTLEEFSQRYLQRFQDKGGFITTIQEADDYLIPNKIPDSVDGSLLVSAYINPSAFLKFAPLETSLIPVDDILNAEVIDAAAFFGYFKNGARIIKDEKLSIREIFGLSYEIQYSDESDFSSSLIIAPCLNVEGDPTNTLKMSSSVEIPVEIKEMITDELWKMGFNAEINHGNEMSQTQISFEGVQLPLNVKIDRETSYISPNLVNVKIHIINNDDSTAKQVIVDDTASLEKYQNVAIQGNLIMEFPEIKSGETKTYEYTIEVDNPGTYIMTPVTMSYKNEDIAFNTESSPSQFKVDRPSTLENLDTTFSSITNTSEELSSIIPENMSKAMKLSTYTIILVTIANGIRKFRTWILS